MEIYLIRHTTPKIKKGICYGQADIPLADTFTSEVEKIISNIKDLDEDIDVYSSPLQRCKQLAEMLFSSQIIYDKRLMELDFGDWELQPWNDIDSNEITPWMTDFVNVKTKNGESYTDLNYRVIDFKQSLKTAAHKKVAIITHAGVIRAFLAQHNNVSLKDSFKYKIAYGEVVVIS